MRQSLAFLSRPSPVRRTSWSQRVVTPLAHVVAGGNEHATRAASRIEHLATRGLDDVHDHADARLGRKETPSSLATAGSKLAEEVLVDAADDIIALLVEGQGRRRRG